MIDETIRYYMNVPATTIRSRSLSGLLVLAAVLSIVFTRSFYVVPVAVVFAAGGIYGLFKRSEPGFFLELGTSALVMNVVTRTAIPYRDISHARFGTYSAPFVLRVPANILLALSDLLGGTKGLRFGKAGETDEGVVDIVFAKRLWTYIALPPFILPRKSWAVPIDGAPDAIEELNRRVSSRPPLTVVDDS